MDRLTKLSAQVAELTERVEKHRRWINEYERKKHRTCLITKTVGTVLASLILAVAVAFLCSCSRPACDYKRLYKGPHSPKPNTHINPLGVPKGSMGGLIKAKL